MLNRYPISAILTVFILLASVGTYTAAAQELDINVTLDKSTISGSSIDYVDELPKKIERYVNKHEWTDDKFHERERIKANFDITLRDYESSNSNFTATLIITLSRPIYNTMQSTQLFQIKDNNWKFTYKDGTSLTHDLLQFGDIESLIDYYVYIILGFDYDSFGSTDGSEFFKQAQSVVDRAQTASSTGWSRSSGDKFSRYSLADDMQSTGYQRLRKAIYRYHRHGLDQFIDDPEAARKEVMEAIRLIRETKRNTTKNYLFDLFFSSKYLELVAIFEDAETDVRLQAYNLLTEIDPGHSSDYGDLQ